MAELSAEPQKPSGPGVKRPAAGAPPAFTADSDVHLLDRLAVIYRYRTITAAVFVLTTIAVMVQGYTRVRMYQAQATLLIEDERSTSMPGVTADPTPSSYDVDPEPYYQTQYKILKGRDLMRRAVKRLHLQTVPEFNGTAIPAKTPFAAAQDLASRLLTSVGLSHRPAAAETPRPDEDADESAMVDAFSGRVQVDPQRGTHLVTISFTAMDPNFAALAINTVADEYVAQNLAYKQRTTQNMLDWLEKEKQRQQEKVEASDRALSEYREKGNALSLDDKQNIVVARLNQLNDAVTKAKTTRVQKESAYQQVSKLPPGASPDSLPVVAQNQTIIGLRGQLSELQRTKAQLSQRYGEKHPEIVKVNQQLGEIQRQIDQETQRALSTVRQEYESARLEEETLTRSLEAAKGDVQDLNRKSVGYNIMDREVQSNRLVYQSLLQRENELSIQANSQANNVRVIDRAEVPKTPITANGRRTWLMAIVIGAVLAIGLAFGLDYMNDTIKTPEDVSRRLKLPFLGLVPAIRGGDKHPLLTSAHVPHDFGESFRALRTALMSNYSEDGAKTMVVTSAQPLEGKTTTACNIAMALAYGGARVLIIDADMRRPGMHHTLRLTNDRGLSQVLVGQARVRDVIQRTVDPNLLAMTAGRTPPNPSELLSSERMKKLLGNLQHGPFDWIIIDTPPVLAATDAVVITPLVSGVTFVIGAEMTRRRLAERALETIMQGHPRFAAAVLNKVDVARNKYYYSRYYGHQYKNYYAEASV
jgi:capsular exopolysaccharide synthesis family protein